MEKLIHVFLNSRIYRTTIDIFEGLAELLRVVVLLFKFHQSAEYALDLVKRVLRLWLNTHVLVLDLEHGLPKRSYHVKLLYNTVHVADAADVF